MPHAPRPHDWRIYADATCAGLSALIPIPLLDLAFERIFRRRMPAAICRARGVEADPATLSALGRGAPWLTTRGCIAAPLAVAAYLVKRLSRKLLYFLTVREAANSLSSYWHRARLVDHLARSGYLARGADGEALRESLEATLDAVSTDALAHVARQFMRGTSHVYRTLRRARRRGAEQAFAAQQAFLGDQLAGLGDHLEAAIGLLDSELDRRRPRPTATSRAGVEA